jgi:hypothetical protein
MAIVDGRYQMCLEMIGRDWDAEHGTGEFEPVKGG